jgi:hypothetical protein
MPGPRNRTGTDPSLNHPLTMSYMGAGSGWEKGWGAGIFTLPCQGEGRRPEGARAWGARQSAVARIERSEIREEN